MSILRLKYRIRLVSTLLASLIAIAALMPFQAQAQSTNVVPYQFIAKLYSEALGRGPDPTGWQTWVNTFLQQGCQLSTLQSVATTFYTVPEFTSMYASDTTYQAQVIAIYRGLLNRDADQGGLANWANTAKSSGWNAVVSGIVGSGEFSGLVPTICSATQPDYGFGGYGPQNSFAANPNYPPPAPTPVTTGSCAGAYVPPGGANDEADLQTKLNSMSSGQTLYLAQDQLIWLTTMLQIPAGVTLQTCGLTQGPYNGDIPYAQMARLARSVSFNTTNGPQQVNIGTGGSMKYVWSDGQRNMTAYDPNTDHNDFNVITAPGAGFTLSYNRISEAQGAMEVGLNPGYPVSVTCTVSMQYNLITGYTSAFAPNPEYNSDGIDDYCEDATIANNWLVDVTDVGILAMGLQSANQFSQINSNLLVQAGNSVNAPICLDQNTSTSGGGYGPLSYISGGTQMTMNGNTFWTSPATTADFGICAGTGEWAMGHTPPWNTSNYGKFTNNSTPAGLNLNTRGGIAVSYGSYDIDIAGNSINANVVNFLTGPGGTSYRGGGCPGGAVIVDGGSSGTIPTATYSGASGSLDGCTTPSNPAANNYQLADPNFATGTVWKGWTVGVGNNQGSTSDATVQDSWNGSAGAFTGYNGNPYELVITDPSNTFFVSAYQTVYGLPAGHALTATVEAEASANLSGGYLAVFNDANSLLCVQYVSNQPSWTPLTCSGGIVPPDGTIQVQLGSGNGEPAGAWVKFDNVTLTVN